MASTLKLGQTPEEGVPLPNELPAEFREMGRSAALLYHEFYLRGEWLYYMLCPRGWAHCAQGRPQPYT